MTEDPSPEPEDLTEQMREFGALASQFAESATAVMGIAIRMQMLMLEQAREGLDDLADELETTLARERAQDQPDD